MLFALMALAAMLVLFSGSRRACEALLTRRTRCAGLRAVFLRFVETSRTTILGEEEIERFLVGTADAESLFPDGLIPRLRLELHDQALRLRRLRVALEEGWAGAGREAVIVEGCREKEVWLDRIAVLLDELFDDAESAPPKLHWLCNEAIGRFNRVIRA